MLTNNQKYHIKSYLEINFFEYLDELASQEDKALACRCALSLHDYLLNQDKLQALNIRECVRDIGIFLSHPYVQNPTSSLVPDPIRANLTEQDDYVLEAHGFQLPYIPIVMFSTDKIRKGLLNITQYNHKSIPINAEDVAKYAQQLIRDKYSVLKSPEAVISEEDCIPKECSPDEFLKYSIAAQCAFLQITAAGYKVKPDNKLFYQLFLSQFKGDNDPYEPLENRVETWHIHAQKVFNRICKLSGSAHVILFSDVINAQIGRCNPIAHGRKPLTHYDFHQLMRIALSHGHTSVIDELIPHYVEIAKALIQSDNVQIFIDFIQKHSEQFDGAKINAIIKKMDLSLSTLPAVEFILQKFTIGKFALSSLLEKIVSGYTLDETFHNKLIALLKVIFYNHFKNKVILSMDILVNLVSIATKAEDIELQSLIYLHLPADSKARVFLTKDLFKHLVKEQHFRAAKLMAELTYNDVLSTEDLHQANKIWPSQFIVEVNQQDEISVRINETPPVVFAPGKPNEQSFSRRARA